MVENALSLSTPICYIHIKGLTRPLPDPCHCWTFAHHIEYLLSAHRDACGTRHLSNNGLVQISCFVHCHIDYLGWAFRHPWFDNHDAFGLCRRNGICR